MKEPILKDSVNEFKDSAKEYVNLKIDEYKLRGVESLSTLLNKLIFILTATILASIIIQFLALALGWWIGSMIGSIAIGMLIDAVIFAIVFILLYLRRDTLLINPMVKLFINVFFSNDGKHR